VAKRLISENVERLLAESKLDEAGRQAGRNVKPLPKRANWRAIGRYWCPASPEELVRGGGMAKLEYLAGSRARDAAIRSEREWWLPRLEHWHAASEEPVRLMLGKEIKRLRRALGIPSDPDRSRVLTRARVARWRAQHRAAAP
jgi:hypothetical protein